VISNEELWRRTGETEMPMQIKRQKWNWIGHTLKDMKPLKDRPWIGTCKGKGGEGDLDICGEELSTMRH
jgi:hypothetical protein